MNKINGNLGILLLRAIIFIAVVLFVIDLVGQENNQSNIAIGNQPIPDRAYIDSLNKTAFSIFRTNPSETRNIAMKSLAFSKTINYPTGQGKANNYIAMSFHLSGSFDTAYHYYQKALGIFQADNDTLNTGKIYNNLALLFTHREYYDLALEYNLKSLKFAQLMNDTKGQFHTYNNIGITYEKLGEYNKAINAYNSSINTIKPEPDTEELYFYALSNIGIINLLTQQYDSAENQIKKGLAYFINKNDNYGISQSYRYLGELYIETRKFKQAETVLDKSNEYATKTDDKKLHIDNQFLRARLHFSKNEFSTAKIIFTNTIKAAQEADFVNAKIESLRYLSKIDSLEGNYFSALKYYQASLFLKDSLNSLKIQNQIAQFSIQYQTLQKDQEITRLKQSEEMKELKINKHLAQRKLFFVIMLTVVILIVFGLYIQQKIKNKNTLLAQQNKEIENKNKELLIHKNQLEELVEQRTMELVKARDKAQESDRLKTAFLLNISHEIRTPLNGILGFADLLSEPDLSGEVQKKYLMRFQDSCNRLLNTVTDLVEISKVETRQVELYKNNINIADEVNIIVKDFEQESAKKGLKIFYKNLLSENHPAIINDKSKLVYIITNLIKNAIKFTPKGTIEVHSCAEDKQILLWVKDTGIGIPAQRQEAIFKHFEQADIEDSQAFQGTGLGLSISKAYIELMGGKIWLESEPENLPAGKEGGSTFFIKIPDLAIKKAAPNTELIIKSPEPTFNKQFKILIAEDDEVSIMHLNILLKDLAREILFAHTGIEAIKQCHENPDIDLILMDIKMPKMGGYEATRNIRVFNKNVTIIAQTAYALAGDEKKALDAGCDGYVTKPINKQQLLTLVNQLFDKGFE